MAVRRPVLPLVLGLALLAGGCGGDDAPEGGSALQPGAGAGKTPKAPKDTGGSNSAAAQEVVREWTALMAKGDVRAAARSFAPGARVQNGPGGRLPDRQAAEAFTSSLTCGSKLVRTEPSAHGYTVAVLELTERPGGDCGSGAGNQAAIAFKVKGDRFTEWLRIQVPGRVDLPDGDEV